MFGSCACPFVVANIVLKRGSIVSGRDEGSNVGENVSVTC